MRISYIEEFLELYDCLNFNTAAKNLHISQSTLSKHIKLLEDDLGATLFERDKYHVEVSAQGLEFYGYAKKVVKNYEAARESFSNQKLSRERLIITGAVDSVKEMTWVTKAAEVVRSRHPEFRPMLVPLGLVSPITQVLHGDVDGTIITLGRNAGEEEVTEVLRAEPVAKTAICAVCHAEEVPEGCTEMTAADLQHKTVIKLVGPRMEAGWRCLKTFLARNQIDYSVRQVPIISRYDYMGVTIKPGEILLMVACDLIEGSALLANPNIKAFPIVADNPWMDLYFVYREEQCPSYIKEFARALRESSDIVATL